MNEKKIAYLLKIRYIHKTQAYKRKIPWFQKTINQKYESYIKRYKHTGC